MFVLHEPEQDAATILHADLDSFYASVEQRDDPRLRGKPVIVGGGVVLAASYEAKAFGVRTAMSGRRVRELCPHAIVVEPHMSAYAEASKAVFQIFENTTPYVEGLSIDEAFLDVGGLRRVAGTPVEIAQRLRARVRHDVGLPITVGVARTKHLAKVASAAAKPDGLLVVPPEEEDAFLHPLPVNRLWGVGPITTAKLHARGITTVGDLAAVGERSLRMMIGPGASRHVHALAHHVDPRSVVVRGRRHSIGSQQALGRAKRDRRELEVVLVGLVDRVMRRMRKAERVGRTVTLRFRFDDFTRATRSHTLRRATSDTKPVLAAATQLLDVALPAIWKRGGLTLLGCSVGNLDDDAAVQLALPFDRSSGGALDAAVDDVRERFGTLSVTRAGQMGRSTALSVPMLPD